jgi:hypothetical protein
MVARIAPSPITTSVAIGDGLTHAPTPGVSNGAGNRHNQQTFPQSESVIQIAASNVPPAPPPGEAFAAAVIAGQLPPRPISPEQLRQRLGSAWQPPASPLRLMDRSA